MTEVPNINSPSYAFTLTASTPQDIPVPKGAQYAKFKSTGNFYASPGKAGGSAPVAPTSATATVSFSAPIAGGDNTDLANDTTEYNASISVDGGAAQPIVVAGEDAQTFDDLVTALNGQVTDGEFAVADGALVFTADSTGAQSTVVLTDGEDEALFASITNFDAIVNQNGTQPTSPMLNPDVVTVYGQTFISVSSDATPVVSVTFYGRDF